MGNMNVSTTTALGAAATAVTSVRTGEAMGCAAGIMKPRVVVALVATNARRRRMPIMLGLKRGGREEVCACGGWWRKGDLREPGSGTGRESEQEHCKDGA